RAQGARILELRVVASYARLLQCRGRSAHALAMLERASRGMAPQRACKDLDGVRRLAITLRRASKRQRTDQISPGSVRGRSCKKRGWRRSVLGDVTARPVQLKDAEPWVFAGRKRRTRSRDGRSGKPPEGRATGALGPGVRLSARPAAAARSCGVRS